MAFVHSLTTTGASDGAALLGNQISEPDYIVDIGFMAESLAGVLAEIQGVDIDTNFGEIMDSLEADHQESGVGDEFVSVLSQDASNAFANGLLPIIDRAVEIMQATELPYMSNDEIRHRLELLQRWCADAVLSGKFVAFHSCE